MSEFSNVADAVVGIALAYASASKKQRDEQFKNLGPELLAPGGAERLRESTLINLQSGRPEGSTRARRRSIGRSHSPKCLYASEAVSMRWLAIRLLSAARKSPVS